LAFGWLGTQPTYFAISQIDPVHFAALAFRVERIVIGRIEQDVKTVPASKRGPITVANTFLTLDSAPSNPVFVILTTARTSAIRCRVVEPHPIISSRRNLAQVVPVFAASKTLIQAAIGSQQ